MTNTKQGAKQDAKDTKASDAKASKETAVPADQAAQAQGGVGNNEPTQTEERAQAQGGPGDNLPPETGQSAIVPGGVNEDREPVTGKAAADQGFRTRELEGELLQAHTALATIRKLATERAALGAGDVVQIIADSGVDMTQFNQLAAGV